MAVLQTHPSALAMMLGFSPTAPQSVATHLSEIGIADPYGKGHVYFYFFYIVWPLAGAGLSLSPDLFLLGSPARGREEPSPPDPQRRGQELNLDFNRAQKGSSSLSQAHWGPADASFTCFTAIRFGSCNIRGE